jgi:arylsulfatase A-like enzyme
MLLAMAANAALPSRHVVMVVWDGMRPDFVSAENTPTLWQLAQRGVVFANHHSTYISATEVNGAVLGTGAYPAHNGIVANREYRPAINPLLSVAMEDMKSIRRGDLLTHGHYLRLATIAETLRAQQPALRTAVAGSKAVAWLLDRGARDDSSSPVVAEGVTLPEPLLQTLKTEHGPFPAINVTKIDRDAWTTTVLLHDFWQEGVPAYSVLWLAEPDWSQHEKGPGAPEAMAGIKNSDAQLAQLLDALRTAGVADSTDVLVVSDHGVSTIDRVVDLAVELSKAGFNATRALPAQSSPGTILVVQNGGSVSFYVIGHDAAVIQRVTEFLQRQEYTGVVFTHEGGRGTFPLSLVKADSPDAPDVVISFRWTPARGRFGALGTVVCEAGAGRRVGEGMHATLSPYDQHNLLIAAGPDFRRGIRDPLPSGNIDVAPTLLWLLGVKPPPTMDGRVLAEALAIDGPAVKSFDVSRHEASRDLGDAEWRQYLTVSQVNGVSYFDEGNGALTKKER